LIFIGYQRLSLLEHIAVPQHKIAIIGAGPAGLSMARLLTDSGKAHVTVYEAQDRIGGKSWTVEAAGDIAEMGTCYLTIAHKQTAAWMKALGVETTRIGEQRYDGHDFMTYVKGAGGAHLYAQVFQLWRQGTKLLKALEAPSPPQTVMDDAAMPIKDWLDARGLAKVERFMHRGLTNMGYGFVDETPTVQALRWCNLELLWTGYRNKLFAPVTGWSDFWQRLAKDIDVRLSAPVERVERRAGHVTIHAGGTVDLHDAVINTIPPDDFVNLTDPTEAERRVAESLDWLAYTTTLFAADNWFTDWQTEGYSDGVQSPHTYGKMVAVRTEAYADELGGQLYVSGQYPGTYSDDELKELLREAVRTQGGTVTNLIQQKTWRYFPCYKHDAIRAGLVGTMKSMQGERRTWYSGAAYSHEAVSNIVRHNKVIAAQILRDLPRAAQRDEA